MFVKTMRVLRRKGHIGHYVNIYMMDGQCHIASDGGRVCRPLIICDAGVSRVKDTHLEDLKQESDLLSLRMRPPRSKTDNLLRQTMQH